MKTFRVPRLFHELFGKETTRLDLALVLLASIGGTGLVLWLDQEHLFLLSLPVLIIILILFADIFGGVVANMTKGTSLYYHERKTLRQIFIIIHIQPIIFAFLIQSYIIESLFIYIYVLLSSTLVNAIRHHHQHQAVAMLMFMMGALILMLSPMPPYVIIFMVFFMMKMIISFACSHTHSRKS